MDNLKLQPEFTKIHYNYVVARYSDKTFVSFFIVFISLRILKECSLLWEIISVFAYTDWHFPTDDVLEKYAFQLVALASALGDRKKKFTKF